MTPAPTVIGVDAGCPTPRDADHLIHHLATALPLPPATVACTHLVPATATATTRPHTAVSLALPDPAAAQAVWDALTVLLSEAPTPAADENGPASVPVAPGSRGQGPASVAAVLGDLSYGPATRARSAAVAAAAHAAREAGRAVLYPGVDRLTGTITVAELLARSAIDHLLVVGAPSPEGQGPDPATPVLTRDHVRPEWRHGRLTLALTPAPGARLAPFEVPNPTPCCADHP